MIRQDDARLPKAINKWGCYFMSILYLAGERKGKVFEPDEIEAIYKSSMATGIVGKEVFDRDGNLIDGCYILDPVALFRLCGVGVNSVVKTGPEYKAKDNELEIQLWHRDANTPSGMNNSAHDHFITDRYDGLGQSNTRKYGYLKSKRIFK